jgi:mono/diheme cytochrome c family protein
MIREYFSLILIGCAGLIPSSSASAKIVVPINCDHAILVANKDYASLSQLDNPANDTEAVGNVLLRHGFSTSRQLNLSAEELRPDALMANVGKGDACKHSTLVLYYAGMALNLAGRPYLVPVDYRPPVPGDKSSSPVEQGLVAVDEIAKGLAKEADSIFIFIDGCAGDDPFGTDYRESTTPTSIPALFAPIPQVKLVVLSAGHGQAALDRDPTYPELSPFARMFADAADIDWPDFDAVMVRVRDGMRRVTGGAQSPDWYRTMGAGVGAQLTGTTATAVQSGSVPPVPESTNPASEPPASRQQAGDIAPPADPTARAAFNAFDANCARCHQIGRLTRSKPSKNFGNILRLDELARDARLISPGKPDDSLLFGLIKKKEEPYDCYMEFECPREPTEGEIKAIYDWIKSLPARPQQNDQSAAASPPAQPADANESHIGSEPSKAEEIVPPTDPTALAAFKVFEKNCARCHQNEKLGQRERPAESFGNVLNLDELARDPNFIMPGNPDGSKLLITILKGHCDGFICDINDAEIDSVRSWIQSLSPRP